MVKRHPKGCWGVRKDKGKLLDGLELSFGSKVTKNSKVRALRQWRFQKKKAGNA